MNTSLHPGRFMHAVREGRVLVADGAMGTLLMERGLRAGECPEAVNLAHPSLLEEIARQYREAGADVVGTNTFGASPLKLAAHGLDARTAEINASAVDAARRGAGAGVFVAGSVGPSGRLLAPYGDTDPDAVFAAFRAQVSALVAAGVDLVLVETMSALDEAVLAVRAARDVSGAIPVAATLTFEETPRGFYTLMGNDIASSARALAGAGADLVGSNCGNGSERMVAIAVEFRRATSLPFIIQSNAGLPEVSGQRVIYPESPAYMAEKALEWIAAGASLIGGCCGTTPAHVAALCRARSAACQ